MGSQTLGGAKAGLLKSDCLGCPRSESSEGPGSHSPVESPLEMSLDRGAQVQESLSLREQHPHPAFQEEL